MFRTYTNIPKTIEAVQFTEKNKDRVFNSLTGNYAADFEDGEPIIKITTIEGNILIVRISDWIIKQNNLGFYTRFTNSEFINIYF